MYHVNRGGEARFIERRASSRASRLRWTSDDPARFISGAVDCQPLPEPGSKLVLAGPWQRVPDLDATQLASGDETLCAIRTNGRVACWGFRGHLLAGDGQTVTPVDVEGLEHVTRLVLARMFGCVLDASAQAKCWGEDSLTRPMPRGGSADVPAPVTVADWAGACDLSAGQDHACVVTADRAVSCIGFTGLREEREVVGPRNAPFRAHGLPGRAAQIFASGNETCVHLEDGAMWCWGSDDYDQLRGEDPENCRVDQLHLTVTPCVSAPQPFELGY